MNVIARLEYEVAYYDSAVHRFNHYTTRTPPEAFGSQNSRCRLCGDRDESIYHIICEYKKRHDWVGNVIHWELCKTPKFDHTNEWYRHNQHPSWRMRHKLLWDFEIQTDHLISTRRPDFIIINKKKKKENLQYCGLCCPGWPHSKIERK